mmetsp:Transcript_8274/g.12931  ORF Transcript_8274/g.12931 Transcript_8274/m.12931 type:complete len:100 (-) Transcript_8274:109-408(-)
MQTLCKELGAPVALTSANLSGESSCTRIEEFSSIWPELALILEAPNDAFRGKPAQGSTIVDFHTPEEYRILRYGEGEVVERIRRVLARYGFTELHLSEE